MYQIGLFSKMNHITTKTLRHYDEIGLLKPAYIDDFTGYRYYSSEQLPRLNKIFALKQIGISLSEIMEIIDETKGVEVFLKLKEKELESKIKKEREMLLNIRNYQKRIRGELVMKYDPVIKSLPEVIVASMRIVAPNYAYYFKIIPEMGKEMERLEAVCAMPEYCFNLYHDGEYKESNIDVEVCEAVEDFCKDSDILKFKKINAVENAICVLHKGPYLYLREVYNFAYEWIKDNGYEPIGLPRESYIDGKWNKDDENEWLTEIQIPINRV
ncbi:MerR family transcriptional regulator [Vallitalea guaymasensis]|uniref:MerR family transcriptional regulator n=1 Tax=Vallitalea guaymasensis TaxID=1185412 RepID=UPI000DE2FDB2|nr:MerR family transcriptional regulator [Vallitalea guaymasensis]